jgi:hypothetical protein
MIDMIVASVLMSMGMLMLAPIMISLPFKRLLFVLVDGWYVFVESIVAGFKLWVYKYELESVILIPLLLGVRDLYGIVIKDFSLHFVSFEMT